MRLFIAINFNEATRFALLALRDRLSAASSRGNFSAPDNLHLTLVFLGECGAERAELIKSVMDSVDFREFPVVIDRVGRFKRAGGDIWWAGVRGSAPLSELQLRLVRGLNAAGFDIDTREYSPHITLGREVITGAVPWRFESFGENVRAMDLMKSERLNGRLTYSPVCTKKAEK